MIENGLMVGFSNAFIAARITYFEGLIVQYETAMSVISSGTMKSYTINTGQTVQTVTKKDESSMQKSLAWAISQLELWMIRRDGGGNTQVVPG